VIASILQVVHGFRQNFGGGELSLTEENVTHNRVVHNLC